MKKEITYKTLKMSPYMLKQLKQIAYMKQQPLMVLINQLLEKWIEDNANLLKQYNELFSE